MNLPTLRRPFLSSFHCGTWIAGWLGLAIVSSAPAHAIDLTALGGLNYAAPTQTLGGGGNLGWTGDAGFSYGFAVAVPIFDLPFEAETGVFVLQENSSRSNGTAAITRKGQMLQIPLVLRFKFDSQIGLGVGGYFAFAQGELERSDSSFVPTTSSVSYATAGEKTNDAGMLVNLRARFNLAPPFYFVIDARYQHGFTNRVTTPDNTFNTRSIQAFAGFQYALDLSGGKDERALYY